MPSPSSHARNPLTPPDALTPIAAHGFATGVLRFGSISLIAHLLLNPLHPVYRGLTLQFKVFIQLSAMTLGGCIFAEKRVSEYNDAVRARNRMMEMQARAASRTQELRESIEREMNSKSG